eukprot:CAMPEP_0197638650 /NCGR_PEP_ID=MMETSP1338-20131121/13519_1 /TAXON_ID=43686 ORGANISM="Pelagodinium beii, Strain RCC1491" /NCGR_SAMPLE_ID=MMETSP1338 /ASSEMBLY_ACC=CAM_ASM_000754 /LENGTH=64 /DNA_ID=CAMNT_0043211263 /DNA_START=497 /DNA_END=688 /DNA_ORIENTATION=-
MQISRDNADSVKWRNLVESSAVVAWDLGVVRQQCSDWRRGAIFDMNHGAPRAYAAQCFMCRALN